MIEDGRIRSAYVCAMPLKSELIVGRVVKSWDPRGTFVGPTWDPTWDPIFRRKNARAFKRCENWENGTVGQVTLVTPGTLLTVYSIMKSLSLLLIILMIMLINTKIFSS